jgi:hypothetical protein
MTLTGSGMSAAGLPSQSPGGDAGPRVQWEAIEPTAKPDGGFTCIELYRMLGVTNRTQLTTQLLRGQIATPSFKLSEKPKI